MRTVSLLVLKQRSGVNSGWWLSVSESPISQWLKKGGEGYVCEFKKPARIDGVLGLLVGRCASRSQDNFYKVLFVSSSDMNTYLKSSQGPNYKNCL